MKIKTIFLVILLFAALSFNTKAQSGANDPTFNPTDVGFNFGYGAYGEVRATSLQSDGKIIIVGDFSAYDGTRRNSIARLNTDGTLDDSFNPGAKFNNLVRTTAFQSDGKIIIGGYFTSYDGLPKGGIIRLNADGTFDATFNPVTGANNKVSTSAIQSDGKIIIGGLFTSYDGIPRNGIARLNTDGTLDDTFDPGTGVKGPDPIHSYSPVREIYTISIQSDGKIIIGGYFTSYNGTTRNHIARLNTDGTIDDTFECGTGANNNVYTTAILSDGKIIIGGSFTSYNGIASKRIARLNADGTLDATFSPGNRPNDRVSTAAIQSDGKIVIGGFGYPYYGYLNYITRLNIDGTIDDAFNSGLKANDIVRTIAIQSDGKIIIGGDFTSYNGTTNNHIARLNVDGTLDATFSPSTGASSSVFTTAIQSDGKIIIGGDFTAYNGTGRNRIARVLNLTTAVKNTLQPKAISVYPNPASDEINIEIEGNNREVKFEILNSVGQVVYKGNIVEKTTVQTSNFPAGAYLIKPGDGRAFEYKKIIKE